MSHWQRVESTKRKKDAEKKKDSEEKMDSDEKKDLEEKGVAQKEKNVPVSMVMSPSQAMDSMDTSVSIASPPPPPPMASGGSGGGSNSVQSVSSGAASNMQTFSNASKRTYNCKECTFVGNGPKGLLNHIKLSNHKDTDSLVERCYTCGFICKDFGELMAHRRSVHYQSINSCRYEKEGHCKWGPDKCWFKHESAPAQNAPNANVGFQADKEMFPPDLVQNMAQEVATMFQQAITRVLQYSGEGERRSQGV